MNKLKSIKDFIDYLDFQSDDTFALRVEDDGMTGAGVLQGDLVVVQRAAAAKEGEMVVALIGKDKAILRFLRKREERYYLDPVSSKYKSIQVNEDVSLVGKVIRVIRVFA